MNITFGEKPVPLKLNITGSLPPVSALATETANEESVKVFQGGASSIVRITFSDEKANYDIGLDAITQRNDADTSTATQYTTSSGTPIVDNVYRQPMQFGCSGIVDSLTSTEDCFGKGNERPKNFKTLLRRMKDNAYTLTITTPDCVYDNMYLLDISSANGIQDAFSAVVTLKFKELPRAYSEYGTVVVKAQETQSGEMAREETQSEADDGPYIEQQQKASYATINQAQANFIVSTIDVGSTLFKFITSGKIKIKL